MGPWVSRWNVVLQIFYPLSPIGQMQHKWRDQREAPPGGPNKVTVVLSSMGTGASSLFQSTWPNGSFTLCCSPGKHWTFWSTRAYLPHDARPIATADRKSLSIIYRQVLPSHRGDHTACTHWLHTQATLVAHTHSTCIQPCIHAQWHVVKVGGHFAWHRVIYNVYGHRNLMQQSSGTGHMHTSSNIFIFTAQHNHIHIATSDDSAHMDTQWTNTSEGTQTSALLTTGQAQTQHIYHQLGICPHGFMSNIT